MFIKITNADTGLIVGKFYNLCDLAAKDLIGKGQAKEVTSKFEIKRAEKEETQRNADKKVARLAGNLTAAAEKATKAAKDAVEAVEAARKAEAEAKAAMQKVQDADTAAADDDTDDETADDTDSDDGDKYAGDFSEFSDDQLAEFAKKADLPVNITNPATIIKNLVAAGFDPGKTETDDE